MEKLKDETKKPWEIVEERPICILGTQEESFVYQRNDGVELWPAESNPWYRMMTASGDPKNVPENRRIWNGYVRSQLRNWPAHEREELLKSLNITLNDIEDWAKGDEEQLEQRLGDNIPEISKYYQTIVLSGLNFIKVFSVAGFIYPCDISFENSHFQKMADFSKTQFSILADFSNAQFSSPADFSNAQFSSWADFSNAQFSSRADFSNAQFSEWADFSNAQFSLGAEFSNAQFSFWADFRNAQFSLGADFSNAQFSNEVDFREGIFESLTNFSKATFDGVTLFEKRKFQTQAPEFYGAQFHPDITFSKDKKLWPDPSHHDPNLNSDKSAYTELRRQMNALHKIDEEQFFQRQEMACQEALEDRGLIKAAYQTFHAFSDYGWSIKKPLFWLLGIWLMGWFLILLFLQFANTKEGFWSEFFFSAILSGASTLPAFGARRELIAQLKNLIPNEANLAEVNFISFITMLQTGLGIFFLFLFILALRNRFRLR